MTYDIIRKYEENFHAAQWCYVKLTRWVSSTETKTVMMQDTPATFMDCAAVYNSGNTQSGVYTLTLPNTTTEVKVKKADLIFRGAAQILFCMIIKDVLYVCTCKD